MRIYLLKKLADKKSKEKNYFVVPAKNIKKISSLDFQQELIKKGLIDNIDEEAEKEKRSENNPKSNVNHQEKNQLIKKNHVPKEFFEVFNFENDDLIMDDLNIPEKFEMIDALQKNSTGALPIEDLILFYNIFNPENSAERVQVNGPCNTLNILDDILSEKPEQLKKTEWVRLISFLAKEIENKLNELKGLSLEQLDKLELRKLLNLYHFCQNIPTFSKNNKVKNDELKIIGENCLRSIELKLLTFLRGKISRTKIFPEFKKYTNDLEYLFNDIKADPLILKESIKLIDYRTADSPFPDKLQNLIEQCFIDRDGYVKYSASESLLLNRIIADFAEKNQNQMKQEDYDKLLKTFSLLNTTLWKPLN